MTQDSTWLDSSAIAVVGHRGSGKTNTACWLLEQMNKPCYTFDHPRPELPESRGWKNMYRLEEMYKVHHCAVLLDEPQLTLPKLDKRANEGLQKLLSIARHRDITLVIATCDSRWITRALEAYIDCWLIHDVEAKLLKQGSLAKKVIQKYVVCDTDEFRLDKGDFLFYGRDYPAMDGLHHAELLPYFDENWSKPWRIGATEVRPEVRPEPTRNGKVGVAG